MKKRTLILAGYYISREELEARSKHQAQTDNYYRRGYEVGGKSSVLGVQFWLERQNLSHLFEQQHPPKAEHVGCDLRCYNINYIFYRHQARADTVANLEPKHWARLEEKPGDIEARKKLEAVFGFKLSEWTVVFWGPRGMVYDPKPETFKERKAEMAELLENGPPGPCDH
ncbi:hypothetical protein FRC08_016631 [Ceratobasidium sp. 394]|nr:hypothetical protein FRC08_016631 [Ceratobasidium sp. 394]KAG9087498.1 hypothetical protein FS749_002872 [Ceratobasidium sp. UAMH 11750]